MAVHRHPRRRAKRSQLSTAYRDPFAAGIPLNLNPNRGKRNAPGLAFMDGFIAELARDTAKAHAPLTVATPLRTPTGRHSRRGGSPEYSSYTI